MVQKNVKMEPLVSICCLTYNHVNFIEDALEGFLKQQVNFPFEIIVHDDASNDGTREKVISYAKNFPEIIFPVLQEVNQYSKRKGSILQMFILPEVRGKYIALCEGDDYWTDPLKLQKQADFMEANPEYSLSVGGFTSFNENTKEKKSVIFRLRENDPDRNGFTFELIYAGGMLTKTLTAFIKKGCFK